MRLVKLARILSICFAKFNGFGLDELRRFYPHAANPQTGVNSSNDNDRSFLSRLWDHNGATSFGRNLEVDKNI